MTERIGIGGGLGLDLNPSQGVEPSIDQGRVLVHAQRGKYMSAKHIMHVTSFCEFYFLSIK